MAVSPKALITETSLTDIGNAIRSKLGVDTRYYPGEMGDAIRSIETGIAYRMSDTTLILDSEGRITGNVNTIQLDGQEYSLPPLSIRRFEIINPAGGIGEMESGLIVRFAVEFSKVPASWTLEGDSKVPVRETETTYGIAGTANHEFILVAQDATPNPVTVRSTALLRMYNWVYYGTAPAGAVDSAFINALADKELTEDIDGQTIEVSAAADSYFWFAVPKRLGSFNFIFSVPTNMQSPVEVSVVNGKRYTEDYYVYQTDSKVSEAMAVTIFKED